MKSLRENDLKVLYLRLKALLKILISLSLIFVLILHFINSLTLILTRLIYNSSYLILELSSF